jgi:hypothetical protein
MGAWEPLLPPIGPSNLVFPLESSLVFCKTSSPGICELSSPVFMDVEFHSNEDILEAMIMDLQPPPELEYLLVGYQRIPCLEPSNGLYLEY